MNKLLIAFCSTFLLHGLTAHAQDVSGYIQKTFVFSSQREVVDADAEQECAEGIEWLTNHTKIRNINPTYFSKNELSIVEVSPNNGRVTSRDVNNIGTILWCIDAQTYPLGSNLYPAYFEIVINDRTYRAAGGGTSADFPEFGTLPGGMRYMVPDTYPEYGANYMDYTATVLPAREPGRGGTLIMSNLAALDGVLRPYFDHTSVGVLSLVQPVKQ